MYGIHSYLHEPFEWLRLLTVIEGSEDNFNDVTGSGSQSIQ
jgi:hypothetical protein